jgi:hypothetical protein
MKNLKLLFFCSIAILMMQCNSNKNLTDSSIPTELEPNIEEEIISEGVIVFEEHIEQDARGNEIDVSEPVIMESMNVDTHIDPRTQTKIAGNTININTFKQSSKSILSGVMITIGEVEQCITNESGACQLIDVNNTQKYTFSKNGFTTRSFTFTDFSKLEKVNIYLSPSMNSSTNTIIKGSVKNKTGGIAANVKVSVGSTEVIIDSNGNYSLNTTQSSSYILKFVDTQNNDNIIEMTVETGDDDEILVDVFIDGFSCCG